MYLLYAYNNSSCSVWFLKLLGSSTSYVKIVVKQEIKIKAEVMSNFVANLTKVKNNCIL